MSEQERKVNTKALLDYIDKIDGEIEALKSRIAEIESKITELRLAGKPVPELPSLVQELETARQQVEALRKRRSELVLVSYNQAMIEYQELQDGLRERLKLDAKTYASQVKKLVDEMFQRYETVEKIFNKAAGSDEPLSRFDDQYCEYKITVDFKNKEKLFNSLVEGFENLMRPRLIKYIYKQSEPAKRLVKIAAESARINPPNMLLFDFKLPRPSYDGGISDE